jgi:hypothetical protein
VKIGVIGRLGRFPVERVETLAGRLVLVRHIFGELHQLGARD